jgi:hypothetical protein
VTTVTHKSEHVITKSGDQSQVTKQVTFLEEQSQVTSQVTFKNKSDENNVIT